MSEKSLRVASVASDAAGDRYINITPQQGEVIEVLMGLMYHDDNGGARNGTWEVYDGAIAVVYFNDAALADSTLVSCYSIDTANPLTNSFPHGAPIVLRYGQRITARVYALAAGKKMYVWYVVHTLQRGVTTQG